MDATGIRFDAGSVDYVKVDVTLRVTKHHAERDDYFTSDEWQGQ